MWFQRGNEYLGTPRSPQIQSVFIDRDFQTKYVGIVLCAALLGICAVLLPIYYFVGQNYSIFIELAYEYAPEVVTHLEQEQSWINLILLSSSIGLFLFFLLLGVRMTAKIVGPLKILRNHIRLVTRGNWSLPPIKVREDDEFQDIIESYNYFYSSYQNVLRKDLERLRQLSINKSHHDAYKAWSEMIREKSSQLDILTSLNDEADVKSPSSRHAS